MRSGVQSSSAASICPCNVKCLADGAIDRLCSRGKSSSNAHGKVELAIKRRSDLMRQPLSQHPTGLTVPRAGIYLATSRDRSTDVSTNVPAADVSRRSAESCKAGGPQRVHTVGLFPLPCTLEREQN